MKQIRAPLRDHSFAHCCAAVELSPSSRAAVTVVAGGGAADPTSERDPGYRGVFPIDPRDWRPLPLAPAFVLAELSLLGALLSGEALRQHREPAYLRGLRAALTASPAPR